MKLIAKKTEEKPQRPGKATALKVAKNTDWSKHSPDRDNTHAVKAAVPFTRKEFDALVERVAPTRFAARLKLITP